MQDTAGRYLRFARREAAGRSPLYEALAIHVAGSPSILAFLDDLPVERRQPNLFFAAVGHVAGTPTDAAALEKALVAHGDEIAAVMVARTTQTNEPGRCATLLPALSRIEGPLALLEVGASAGLCLLPDRYGYDWGASRLDGPQGAPVFPCVAGRRTPLPTRYPEVVWRAGLDLNPLNLGDDADVAWLERLVWPEDRERLLRLQAAIALARADPPRVVAGDLRGDLPTLIAEAPRDATLVVFHTAVLNYVPRQVDRDAFAAQMLGADVVWISNEAPGVFPQYADGLPDARDDMFLMCVDGAPVARTGPHGQRIDWL